jgi:ribose transport system ATP-binding protein
MVALSAQHVVKRYGGVVALADGNLNVRSGEVVAMLGANGSGKSTLSKIITGVVAPDEGSLTVDGQPVSFRSPQAARKMGITAVYQELSLVPDLTVNENIWLRHEPLRAGLLVNGVKMRARTRELLALFEGTVHYLGPDVPVKNLPPGERQVVEILKALSTDPRLLILDEATASLDSQQVDRLFELIARWKAEGKAIAFVSHRMDEIFRVADRATVLRSGRTVADTPIGETSHEALVQLMIAGAAPSRGGLPPVAHDQPVVVEASNLSAGALKGVSFSVRAGEILGIGGLQGQGQSDLLLALFGAVPYSGQVKLEGRPVRFRHPREAMGQRVAFVPGDRGAEGLLYIRSILENLHLPSWSKFGTPLRMGQARAEATGTAASLSLVMASLDAPVSSLSGGNAQKVVLGKWLSREPRLFLLNDPTKGVDVGAKGEFYELLMRLCAEGTAIILYSSDDDELLGLCHRVLVLHDGTVAAELDAGHDLNHENLVAASLGSSQERAL